MQFNSGKMSSQDGPGGWFWEWALTLFPLSQDKWNKPRMHGLSQDFTTFHQALSSVSKFSSTLSGCQMQLQDPEGVSQV